jgi:hypothetical protein
MLQGAERAGIAAIEEEKQEKQRSGKTPEAGRPGERGILEAEEERSKGNEQDGEQPADADTESLPDQEKAPGYKTNRSTGKKHGGGNGGHGHLFSRIDALGIGGTR